MKFTQITAEEEGFLFRLVSYGCNRAVTKLVEANLGLVVFVVNRYSSCRSLSFEELLSEGSIGLTKAVKRYEVGAGTKLSTYAVWWIRQAISRAMVWKTRTVRLPSHVILRARRYKRQLEGLEREGRDVKKEDLEGYNSFCLTEASTTVDLVNSGLNETGSSGDEFIESDFKEAMLGQLETLLDNLQPRYRYVIVKRYGIRCKKMTLGELSKEMKVTRERVRQIQAAATKQLRVELIKRE